MLDLHRLRILREIDQRGTITAAARALYLTPPSISHHMSTLETETGVQLLERVGRRVRLTPAARQLVEHTEAMLRHMEAAEADLALARDEVSGQFTIAAITTAGCSILIPAAAELSKLHPALELRLLDADPPHSLVELRSGAIDVVLGLEYNFTPTLDISGLDTELLLSEPVYIAMPASHPLATPDVTLSDLAEDLWIAPREPNPCHQAVLRAAASAGFVPRMLPLESTNYPMIVAAISHGMGVTVLPHLAMQACDDGVFIKPLDEMPLRRRVYAAFRDGGREHPAISAIIDSLKRAADRVAEELPS